MTVSNGGDGMTSSAGDKRMTLSNGGDGMTMGCDESATPSPHLERQSCQVPEP